MGPDWTKQSNKKDFSRQIARRSSCLRCCLFLNLIKSIHCHCPDEESTLIFGCHCLSVSPLTIIPRRDETDRQPDRESTSTRTLTRRCRPAPFELDAPLGARGPSSGCGPPSGLPFLVTRPSDDSTSPTATSPVHTHTHAHTYPYTSVTQARLLYPSSTSRRPFAFPAPSRHETPFWARP